MEMRKKIYSADYIRAGRWAVNHPKPFNNTCPFILGLHMTPQTATVVYNQLLGDGVIKKQKNLSYANMTSEEFETLISSHSKNAIGEMTTSEKKLHLRQLLTQMGFSEVKKVGFTYKAIKNGKDYAIYITDSEQSVYNAIVSSRFQNTEGTLILGQNFVERHVILASYMNIELYDLTREMFVNTKSVEGIIPLLKEINKELDEIEIEGRTLEHFFESEKLSIKCLPIACDDHKRVFLLQGVTIDNLQILNRFVIGFLSDSIKKYAGAHLILEAGEIYLFTN